MSESIDMLREEIAALREKLAAAEKDRDAALDSLRAHDAGRRTGLVHRELYAQVMRQRDEAREKLDAALEAARPMEVAVEASVGRPDDLVIHVTLVTLRAVVSALAPAPSAPPRDREDRCRRCGWPLAKSIREGCVPGNCSYRPEEGSEEWKRMRDRDTARAALDSYLAGKTDSHGRPVEPTPFEADTMGHEEPAPTSEYRRTTDPITGETLYLRRHASSAAPAPGAVDLERTLTAAERMRAVFGACAKCGGSGNEPGTQTGEDGSKPCCECKGSGSPDCQKETK